MDKQIEWRDVEYEAWKRKMYAERGQKISQVAQTMINGGKIAWAAPVGYLNHKRSDGTREVLVDHRLAPLVRQSFELVVEGKYSLREALKIMTARGLVSRSGKPMGISSFCAMLRNEFYCGMICAEGGTVAGRHQAIVDMKLFMLVNTRSSAAKDC